MTDCASTVYLGRRYRDKARKAEGFLGVTPKIKGEGAG